MKNLSTLGRIILSTALPLFFLPIMLTATYKTNVTSGGWNNTPVSELGWLWQAVIVLVTILLWWVWAPVKAENSAQGE